MVTGESFTAAPPLVENLDPQGWQMSGLAALLAGHNPPDLYQWHSAAHVPDVQHAVEHAGWEFVYLDGWTIEDKESFLTAAAHAFDAEDDKGASFDALSDCLGDEADQCSLFDQTQRRTAAGLTHRSARERHDVLNRFRRLNVGRKARRGIFSLLSTESDLDKTPYKEKQPHS